MKASAIATQLKMQEGTQENMTLENMTQENQWENQEGPQIANDFAATKANLVSCIEDVFCHVSAITDGNALPEGQKVSYDVSYDERRQKYRAANVTGGTNEERAQRRFRWVILKGWLSLQLISSLQ